MVIIQSIKQDKSGYIVTTNQGDYVLAEDVLVSFFITKGKEYTSLEWKNILKRHELEDYLKKAYHYLSFKERTTKEVKEFLEGKGCIDTSEILEELKQKQYLNDERYVEHYLAYCKNRFKGPLVFERDLKQKGIKNELIKEGLFQYTFDIQYDVLDQYLIKQLKPTKYSQKKFEQSLLQKCLNQGFSYGLINEVIANRRDEFATCVDEDTQLQKEIVKLQKYPKAKQIQKLLQKGFSYERIIKFVDNQSDD